MFGGDADQIIPPGVARKNGAVVPRTNLVHVNTANIPDGASVTILVGERQTNRKWLGNDPNHLYDGDENNGYMDGWDWDTMRWSHGVPAPDRWDDVNCSRIFGSAHQAGVNFLFADGSIRLVGYDVTLTTFQQLCDRDDGQVIDLDAVLR
jgi:prepilin-type processing-associated H-X9-DG protein